MKKIFILTLISFIILSSSLIVTPSQAETSHPDPTYTSSPPIRINNNSDLASNSTSGNGTEANPYIIEDLEINGTNSSYCIYVTNTTKHFILQNCLLYGADIFNGVPDESASGIVFNKVTNGTIKGNIVHSNNVEDGIFIYNSTLCEVNNNRVYQNEDGIALWYSTNNTVHDNNIYNNTQNGLEIHSSSNYNTFYNNTVNESGSYNIWLYESDDNIIYNNYFKNYSTPLSIFESYNNTWNLSYPTGGNYWDTYTGHDKFSGVNQNMVGRDNIGDTSYELKTDNIDYYPLFLGWEDYDFVRETIPKANETSVHVDQDISIIFIGTMNTSKDVSLTIKNENFTNIRFQGWSTTYKTNDTATFTHNNLHFDTEHETTTTFLSNETYTWQYTTENFGEYVTRIVSPIAISIFMISVLIVSIKLIFSSIKGGTDEYERYD